MDYFLARYYSSAQGRFTSPDEFVGGPDALYYFAADASNNPTLYADLYEPQSLNKYQYCYNNPLRYADSDGHQQTDRLGNHTRPAPPGTLPYDLAKALADATTDLATETVDTVTRASKSVWRVIKKITDDCGECADGGDGKLVRDINDLKREAQGQQAAQQESEQLQPQNIDKGTNKPKKELTPDETNDQQKGLEIGQRRASQDAKKEARTEGARPGSRVRQSRIAGTKKTARQNPKTALKRVMDLYNARIRNKNAKDD